MCAHARSAEAPATTPLDVAAITRVLVEERAAFSMFLERRLGNRADAEEILQEAFARSLGRLEALRNPESAVAWFYRVLRNAVVDHHRRQKTASRGLLALSAELACTDELPEEAGKVCRCVGRLATTLKPEYAQALQRVEVEGVPVKNFAGEAGISSGNAAVRIFRARQALRRRVQAWCGECAAQGCRHCSCAAPDAE